MASFAEILAKKPKVQTRQALMVIGLQNDFIKPTGHLPVDSSTGFLDNISSLTSKFRGLDGNIIWVQTLFEADRLANTSSTGEGDALVIAGLLDGEEMSSQAGDDESTKDLPISAPQAQSRSAKHKQRALDLFKRVSSRRKALPVEEAKVTIEEDDELFLLMRAKKGAACMPNTAGAQFTEDIKDRIETPRDALIKTTNYSAFFGTNLLLTLRARLITEIYVCGCLSNVSVLATVIDGARHGIKINVVQDALGYRKQARHDLALKRMEDFFDAYIITTADVLAKEHFEVVLPAQEEQKSDKKDGGKPKDELEKLIGNMSLEEKPRAALTMPAERSAQMQNTASNPVKMPDSKILTDLASAQPNSDEDFSATIVRSRRTNGIEQQSTEANGAKLVQSKTRMRKKKKKSKPSEGSLVSPDIPSEDSKQVPSHAQPATATLEEIEELKSEALAAEAKGNDIRKDGIPTESSKASCVKTTVSSHSGLSAHESQCIPDQETSNDFIDEVVANQEHTISSALTLKSIAPSLESQGTPPIVEQSSTEPESSRSTKTSKVKSLANLPVLGPGDWIATGDSRIIHDLIPPDFHHPSAPTKALADTIFQQLYNEVRWQKMLHQQGEVPRLVCCQGEFGDDGSKPVYRHPTDQALPLLHFSPKVQWVRRAAEKHVGHPLNHVLIQLYRSGNDYISEHSDKTLDIAKGSSIVNVSFGAQRTMRLRTKKNSRSKHDNEEDAQRETQRVAMPHNSMFVLGLDSNEKWLHGIMADKRIEAERSRLESAHSGARISLTFRHIATYLDARETVIWGQGATSKDQRGAADVVNNDEAEAERMIRAFSRENHSNNFEWEEWYGDGFDVLHLHEAFEQLPILFAGSDALETKQVQLALWESKTNHTLLERPELDEDVVASPRPMFRDNDMNSTEVEGLSSILHYLDRYHSFCADRPVTATSYALVASLTRIPALVPSEADNPASSSDSTVSPGILHMLYERLREHGGPFIAGKRFSIADCMVWPMLDQCMVNQGGWNELEWPELAEYYRLAWKKKACLKKLKAELTPTKATTSINKAV